MSVDAGNGWAFRVQNLERRVDRIEQLEPAVQRQQLQDVKEDLREVAEAVADVRRILIGFLITFAVLAVGTVVTVMQITSGP